MKDLILKRSFGRLGVIKVLVIALIWICLSACNGSLASARIVQTEKTRVIIPEEIPEDLLEVPPCEEYEEITWGQARDASDHYRRCSDLRGTRIETLSTTIKGRWAWLEKEKALAEEDQTDLDKKAEELFKED